LPARKKEDNKKKKANSFKGRRDGHQETASGRVQNKRVSSDPHKKKHGREEREKKEREITAAMETKGRWRMKATKSSIPIKGGREWL